MKKRLVLSTTISVGRYKEFINEVFALVRYKVPSYVCFANVHMVVEGHRSHEFQKIINDAAIVAPDGRPISLFLKHFEQMHQDRVCGMDLLPDLLRRAELYGKSVYFYGSTDELLQTIVEKASREFPALTIAGTYSPPFREMTDAENEEAIERIKKSNADLVFVSLGCPKQEKWMHANKDKIGACLLGLGQAFKTYAGVEKRLPKWMRNLSLEWLYRLYLEPGRLWKRYFFTNTYFLVQVLNLSLSRFGQELSAPFLKVKFPGRIAGESE
jgi:N-acetylglucosaminyldiphosphoundecaprenol N-acetyl-beta-D-mannosaminyltransferase